MRGLLCQDFMAAGDVSDLVSGKKKEKAG